MAFDFGENIEHEVNSNVAGRLQVGNVSVKEHRARSIAQRTQSYRWGPGDSTICWDYVFRRIFAVRRGGSRGGKWLFWKGDGKGAPVARVAGNINLAAMGVGNCLGQAEPQTSACLWPAGVASIKSLKDMGKILF